MSGMGAERASARVILYACSPPVADLYYSRAGEA